MSEPPRAYIRRASEKHRSHSALGGQRVASGVGSEALFQMSKFDWKKKDALRETRSHHDMGESFDDLSYMLIPDVVGRWVERCSRAKACAF
jgi:hypothetical protein